jgi:hypothetical protein
MFAAADSRQGLFYVAFIVQALHQPYKRSQKVPKSPEPKMGAHMPLTEKISSKQN